MKRLFILIPILTLILSCDTNDDVQPQAQEEPNFYALTLGNSWVYKNYKYNIGTELYEDTGVVDSISIVSTEELDGHTYYKFKRKTTGNENNITFCNENGEYYEFLRDSLGNLVSNDGRIRFTHTDYSERSLSENSGLTIFEKLMVGTTELTVEAGTFTCVNSERYARNANDEQTPGLDTNYYSDGIGRIYDTSSFVFWEIPTIIRRLDSYDIQ